MPSGWNSQMRRRSSPCCPSWAVSPTRYYTKSCRAPVTSCRAHHSAIRPFSASLVSQILMKMTTLAPLTVDKIQCARSLKASVLCDWPTSVVIGYPGAAKGRGSVTMVREYARGDILVPSKWRFDLAKPRIIRSMARKRRIQSVCFLILRNVSHSLNSSIDTLRSLLCHKDHYTVATFSSSGRIHRHEE